MIVSLDAPLIETYRVMVSTPQAYYTFVKSGEDQTYIAQALKDYPYQDLLDQVKGRKIILPTHPDTFSPKDIPVISVLRNITDYTGRKYGMVEVQNEYESGGYLYHRVQYRGNGRIFRKRTAHLPLGYRGCGYRIFEFPLSVLERQRGGSR